MTQLAHEIARSLQAQHTCEKDTLDNIKLNNISRAEHWQAWADRHAARVAAMCKEWMPSGSGFDNGTKLNKASKPDRLVFDTAFHHMDSDSGMYTRWTEHSVIVTPSLVHGFNVQVTGRDYREIKAYIAEAFHEALGAQVSLDTLLRNDGSL